MQTPIRMPICFLFVWVCVSTPPTVIAADGDTDKVIWFAPHQTQIEECHQWTAIFWEWRETGIVPANAINFLWLTWWGDGHAMTVFRSGGFYYVIDPQSGQVRGPFSDWNNMRSGAWQLLREISDPSMNDPYLPSTEIRRTRTIVEPQPWYTDPLLKQQVLDCLGITNPGLYLPDIS